jgi:hypothetical protein
MVGTAPPYEGPFTVLRRTSGGSYVLMDSDQHLAPRHYSPNMLQLISKNPANVPVMVSILGARDKPSRAYLVRWSTHPQSPDVWLPAHRIQPPSLIHTFLKSFTPHLVVSLRGDDVVPGVHPAPAARQPLHGNHVIRRVPRLRLTLRAA